MARKVKFGISGAVPGQTPDYLIEQTRRFERGHFDSVWFPDHLVFMAKTMTPEVWSVITAAAMKTTKVSMGTIGDPHRVHPAVLAQRLATVDHISGGGRVFVCLGYGEKMNLDPYGIPWDRPLVRLEESVQVMRRLWSGESVSFKGEFFTLDEAEVRIYPATKKGISIYIAATGPRALEVAGRYGNGWVTNAMPAHLFKKKAKVVSEAAKGRPRGLGRIEKTLFIFLSIARDSDTAYSSIEPVKHALIWPELLHEAGYDIEIAKKYQGLAYTKIMPNDPIMLRKFREMGDEYYTQEIVMDFIIAGTPAQVRERIEQYIKAGVDHFIFRDFSPDRDYSYRVLTRSIMPGFRD